MGGFDNDVIHGIGLDLSGGTPVTNKLNVNGALYIGNATGNPVATVPSSSDSILSINVGPGSLDFSAGTGLTDNFLQAVNNLSDVDSTGTARNNLGLGSMATQAASSVVITGGSITGITDLAVADGGTGASSASDARTNLGVVIGTDVQAFDQGLQDIAGLAVTDSNFIVGDGVNWVAETGVTARTSLGLGTISTQSAASVSITGGSITGITDLVVADGGTGVSTLTNHAILLGAAASPITSVGPSATAGQILQSAGAAADPVFSTATFPSTAAGTGTILRADGTNWVASTPTFANVAGTAGKVLVSDGTNFITSTPTFPNASATTRKIIVSDGTNWVASTETYAVPGTSGNVLTSDGTNWTSAAPSGGGAMVFIATASASASATISFTGLTSTYFKYVVEITNLAPATDGVFFQMRTSTDNGASYDSGASDYAWMSFSYEMDTGPGPVDSGDNADTKINITPEVAVVALGNAANEINSLTINLENPSAATFFQCNWYGSITDNAGVRRILNGGGVRLAAADVDAIQFAMSTGNIATGIFKLYGIKAS